MASKTSTKKASTAKAVKKSYTEPGYKVTRGKTTTAYGIAQAEKFAQKKATANKATKVDKNKLVAIATKNPKKNDLKPIATKTEPSYKQAQKNKQLVSIATKNPKKEELTPIKSVSSKKKPIR